MKKDRFLLGILIFIGLLILAALALFFLRTRQPAYGTDDTPQGVVRDYAVALQNGDYERAFGYLAKMNTRPTYDTFSTAFLTRQLDISTAALEVGAVTRQDPGGTWVAVSVQYAGSGPFDSGWSNPDRAVLIQQGTAWKITYLPYPYFDNGNWFQPIPEPTK